MQSSLSLKRLTTAVLASMSTLFAASCSVALPSQQVPLADGSVRSFYTTGPMGVTTRRVDVSSSGSVVADVQVLNEAVFQSIQPGMRSADISMLIGPPYRKERFPRTDTTAWDYHYRDAWGYDADFSVTFDHDGVMVAKSAIRNGN
jgi:outer membrane protein assembly factor BamE (lipoprotein component of BamABCDE complex)